MCGFSSSLVVITFYTANVGEFHISNEVYQICANDFEEAYQNRKTYKFYEVQTNNLSINYRSAINDWSYFYTANKDHLHLFPFPSNNNIIIVGNRMK